MIHFTDNQKLILEELKQRPDATNDDLIRALNVKGWVVHKALADLREMLSAPRRYALVGRAEAAGWRSTCSESHDETIERHVTRLVADSFPDGPWKPLAIKTESLHHEVANMATQAWGQCENQTPVTGILLDRMRARVARARALLNRVDGLIDEARKIQ